MRQIRYFVAIADELNISRAASNLFVSQPSMSHFLSKLESDLGVKLFIRTPNSALTLTEAGHIYLEGARQILAIQEEVLQKIGAIKNKQEDHFAFGFAGVQNSKILSRFVDRFFKMHPELKIDIVERGTYELMQMVVDNQLNMAYAPFDPQDLNPTLEYVPLADIALTVIVPVTHELAKAQTEPGARQTVSLSELADEPLAVIKPNTVQRKVLDQYFKQHKFRPVIQVETHSTYSTLSYVESGASIGISPRSAPSDLAVYLPLDPPASYQIGLYYNKQAGLTRLQRDCIQIMQDVLARSEPQQLY